MKRSTHAALASAVLLSLGSVAIAAESQQQNGQSAATKDQQGQGKSASPEQVRQAQQKLNAMGYKSGTVDGIEGRQTESAVKQFQQSKGLEATGDLDEPTLSALEIVVMVPESSGAPAAPDASGAPASPDASPAPEQQGTNPDAGGAPTETPTPSQ